MNNKIVAAILRQCQEENSDSPLSPNYDQSLKNEKLKNMSMWRRLHAYTTLSDRKVAFPLQRMLSMFYSYLQFEFLI